MACYKPDNSPYYHVRFMFQGKMVRRSTKTTSVAIAKRLEAKWRNELLTAVFTLTDYITTFIEPRLEVIIG